MVDGLSVTRPPITIYLDDILLHSGNVEENGHHLQGVIQRLADAGLILMGKKCHIGMMLLVSYLVHIFSSSGMEPDSK